MKSRIQWKRTRATDTHPVSYTGTVKECDFFINMYKYYDDWCWTIRSKAYHQNLVIGGNKHKLLRDAKAEAVKWMLVQLLIRIDPDMFRGIQNEHYTIPWFQSFDVFLNGQRIPQINPFRSNPSRLDKGHSSK